MKRIVFAVVFLIIAVVLSGVSLYFETGVSSSLIDRIDTIHEDYLSGDSVACRTHTKLLAEQASKEMKSLEYFLHHNKIREILDITSTLPALLDTDPNEGFPVELARCRSRLSLLRHAEYPSLGNLF